MKVKYTIHQMSRVIEIPDDEFDDRDTDRDDLIDEWVRYEVDESVQWDYEVIPDAKD